MTAPSVTHIIHPVATPTIPLKQMTRRRFRQLDGRLVHQFWSESGRADDLGQVFNTDGKNWWQVITAIRRRDGHVRVFA